MSKPTKLSLERGVLWFEDGTEVSNVSVEILKAIPELLKSLKDTRKWLIEYNLEYDNGSARKLLSDVNYAIDLTEPDHFSDTEDEDIL
jgi:hypothetical protein